MVGERQETVSAQRSLPSCGRLAGLLTIVVMTLAPSGRAAGQTSRVSLASGGGQGAGGHSVLGLNNAVDHGGRFVAFVSSATNLVPNDNNGLADVFVHDRLSLVTSRVSVASGVGGLAANADRASSFPAISADGRFVAFSSGATNLVPSDTNGLVDVFLRDRVAGTTSRISVGATGVQAVGGGDSDGSRGPSISADGRYVAFESEATNLVPNDTNRGWDIFVHDRTTGATERVSLATGGAQANVPGEDLGSNTPSISGDGRFVAFESNAANLGAGVSYAVWQVLVHDRVARTSRDGTVVVFTSAATDLVSGDTNGYNDVFAHGGLPTGYVFTVSKSGSGSGTVSSTPGGIACGSDCSENFTPGTQVTLTATPSDGSYFAGWSGGGCSGTGSCSVTLNTATTVTATFHDSGSRTLSINVAGSGKGSVSANPGITCDGECEPKYPTGTVVTLTATAGASSTFSGWSGACSGASSCVVPLDQSRSVTATFTGEPATTFTRYLAEGATSSFFDMRVALLNPGDADATATVTFSPAGKAPVSGKIPVPARRRVTLDPKRDAGLADEQFATRVDSDQPLVVGRTMSWDVANGYGAHAETAVAAPALTWYLAEGATHSGFNLFYLLQNPNSATAQVRVRFLRPAPQPPLERMYDLAPHSRSNIWVDVEEFDGQAVLANTDVSAAFEVVNGQPIIVERAMYLDRPGQMFAAGHESAGVTAPAMEWFLAEGATGAFFDLFVLIANPETSAAAIDATYLLPDGRTIVKSYTVPPNSRQNIWVDLEDTRLADTAVSTTIRSTNGVPIIVERAMWWPGTAGTWYEAHNSAGATSTARRWALAEGEVGGPRNADTYMLVANTSPTRAEVRVTLLFEDGTSAARTFAVAGNSRFNVDARTEFAEARDRRFGALVESVGAAPAEIVVERAMYWNALGQTWAAGTNALGTKLQ